MSQNYDFNGSVPKDRIYNNLTVQCKNICARDTGLVPQDLICQEVFVQNVLNQCSKIGIIATDPQWDAYRQAAMRIYSALYQQCLAQTTVWQNNGDETNIPNFLAMFGKALPHNAITGRTDVAAYAAMRDAIDARDEILLGNVPMGSIGAQLKQPLTTFILNFMGPAPSTISVPPCPSMSSAESAAEMVECYCHALARDVPFADYGTSPIIANCVNYLNATSDFQGNTPVTSDNIFRGRGIGDLIGPYLSQFFWIDAPYWPNSISPQTTFPVPSNANDRMITAVNYINSQNGIHTEPALALDPTRYAYVARDLAYNVWNDWPGQLFELAARKALAAGASYTPKSPYLNNPIYANQCTFILWTINDLLAVLYNGSQAAMSGAWYTKWAINRRIRPEAFANEVEQWRLSGMTQNPASIDNDLLTNGCLADIFALNGNYYLPQVYPEGSPAHPAYPSGHATFSGFGITIVKAFLDENFVFPAPVQVDNTGMIIPFVGPALTLGHELNKLASNVGIGRDWAGVHYRSDCYQGILLGEQIAIQVLQDFVNHYAESPACFQFHGYLGNLITIVPQTSYGHQIQKTEVSFQVPDCCS